MFNETPQPCYGENQENDQDLIERFLQHVTEAPNKRAILTTDDAWTYQALYDLVLIYRRQLFALNLQNKPVVVCLERTPQLIAVLLALQWMKVTYIPVDFSIPIQRLQLIMDDSEASFCIADEERIAALTATGLMDYQAVSLIARDSFAKKILALGKAVNPRPSRTLSSENSANDRAYIIYTSGSTGVPKGVAVGRAAFNNFLKAMSQYFMQEVDSLCLAITTVAFDIAALELFLPLWQQKTILFANQEQHKDPFMLVALLEQFPVTHLQATPAMWQMLYEMGWSGKSSLIALSGGEALSSVLMTNLLSKVRELWNLYGPTEATIWCSLKRLEKNERITIGKPIANMNLRVLDNGHAILPPYVKGVLYIGGVGLADGYLNRQDLTNTQFIRCKKTGERLYCAGDIACTNAEGEFLLFGRTDNQIKLNGYRIELGEIEACLQSIAGVSVGAVLVQQKQLMAYVSLQTGSQLTEYSILHQLARMLPEYMLPKRCVFLDKFPLTVSGKLDRKSLPVDTVRPILEKESPQNQTELELLALWQSILSAPSIGVTDHFYSLGGHSLLALQLAVQLNSQFHRDFKLVDVLNHPTIRAQAGLIKTTTMLSTPKIVTSNEQKAPLTPTQQRIWVASKLYADRMVETMTGVEYHMAAQLKIKGPLDSLRLKNALMALAERHDALRTIIEVVDYEPYQVVQPRIFLPFIQLTEMDNQSLLNWICKPFDETGPWWRSAVFVEAGVTENWVLVICLHHLLADGYSVALFLRELWALYTDPKALLPLCYRYIDAIHFENNKVDAPEDITFWQQELLNCPYLRLPHDRVNCQPSGQGAQLMSVIAREQWSVITAFCQNAQVSISSFFIGAFALLMQQYSEQSDFCMGMPFANREHKAVRDQIGCFMDLLPLRIVIPTQLTFLSWVKQMDQYLIQCLAHRNLPFSSLLQELAISRDETRSPLFPVILNIQPDPFKEQYSNELTMLIEPIHTQTSKYDLSLEIYFTAEEAICYWEYDVSIFKEETIALMAERLMGVITAGLHAPKNTISIESLTTKQALTTQLNPQKSYRAPETPIQQTIASIWQKVLQVTRVGLDDHFFSLGGHSFLAARMISLLAAELNHAIPIECVFRYSKFEDFCAAIKAHKPTVMTSLVKKTTQPSLVSLTPNQHQMVLALRESPHETYHVSVLIECPLDFDSDRFEVVLNAVLRCHSSYFFYVASQTTQGHFASSIELPIDVILLEAGADVYAVAEQQNRIPIRLDNPPLLRVTLLSGQQKALLITIHHLIGDEWSLQRLVQTLFHHYQNQDLLPIVRTQWEIFVDSWTTPSALCEQYWHDYLTSAQQQSDVPSTKNENFIQADQAVLGRTTQIISASVIQSCELLARQHNATLYHVLLALFMQLTRLMTEQQERVTFAVTYDRRQTEALQELQGYLVNLAPLTCEMGIFAKFSELLDWVKINHIEALNHSNVDYALLMSKGWVTAPKMVFNYQHTPDVMWEETPLQWQPIDNQHLRFPIVFHLCKAITGDLVVTIDYQQSRYHATFIDSMANIYADLMQQLSRQHLVAMMNWHFQVSQGSDTSSKVETAGFKKDSQAMGLDWMSLLNQPGHRYPNALAVYYDGASKTYCELWQDVGHVALALKSQYGALNLSGSIIGICLANRYHYLLSILAVLRVGGAFLPIEINLPIERQNYLVADSGASLVIDAFVFENLITSTCFDSSDGQLAETIDSSKPAYIIYTSGTTGNPKAVVISRGALQQFIASLQARLQMNTADRILQFSSVSFDASIWEIFLAFISGAALIIPNEKERYVGGALQGFMMAQQITHTILTPSVLSTLNPALLPTLRCVVSGGEKCSPSLLQLWLNHVEFYNAYGPTEATVCVALGQFSATTPANCIGSALGEAKLKVVSDSLNPLAVGMIGELLVGGPIVALGYLNQDALTKERFIFIDGERWYRTGDKVRQNPEGQLAYFGRQDRQVKLRGLRIELEEIEITLCSFPEIRQACCLIKQEQILAYLVVDSEIDDLALFNYLARRLPNYLLPHQIIPMATFPLLPSGKIDSQRLQEYQARSRQMAITKPRHDLEQKIHAVWSRYFPGQELDIFSDFFRLGGNSLQAMSIASELEEYFGMNFSIHDFYLYGSIASQSAYIESQDADKTSAERISLDEMDPLLDQLSDDEKQELLKALEL